ncbi:MAG: T9SS type A sorting domain-containing protein [Bacteroidota bacterium]
MTSECTFDLDERRWRVTNPNSFDLEVTWQVFGTSQSGSLTTTPGLTHFTTMNTGGANTTKIFWQDENGNTKDKTKAANNNLCDVNPVQARFGSVEINENISSLAEGTYFMIVNVNGQTITKQFVKSAR